MLSEKVSYKAINKLLTLDNGLWKKFVPQFIKDLEHDFNLMHQFALGEKNLRFKLIDTSWQNIWKELKNYWSTSSNRPHEKYLPLAKLFEEFGTAKVSAVFGSTRQSSNRRSQNW